MSSQQAIRDLEMFALALRHMGKEDLHYLNHMVVERRNRLALAKSTAKLAQFAEVDRVQFTATEAASSSASHCA